MSEMITSKVRVSTKKGGYISLELGVPKEVAEALGLQPTSVVSWEIREDKGRRVAVVRKLE